MFGVIQIRPVSMMRLFRGMRTNSILRDAKPPTTASSSSPGVHSGKVIDGHLHTPTDWEKTILVWSKVYPNKESIPPTITEDAMQKAMSRGRIRIANYMVVASIIGCLYVVITGKKNVKEQTKNASTEHDDVRRQIISEYKNLLNTEKKN